LSPYHRVDIVILRTDITGQDIQDRHIGQTDRTGRTRQTDSWTGGVRQTDGQS